MWTGYLSFDYNPAVLLAQAKAYSGFMSPENFDDAADMGLELVFQNPGGVKAVGNSLIYAEPVSNPGVYNPFISMPDADLSLSKLTDVSGIVGQTTGTLSPNASRYVPTYGNV